jgi:hypothetical protein
LNTAVLQTQLQLPYRTESWRSLLRQLFSDIELFASPIERPLTTQSETALARNLIQFGRVTLVDGKLIGLFEVEVASGVDLGRNRVGLRTLIARCIDEVNAHAVLAFFLQPGVDVYRLTYAARESTLDLETLLIETRETATRRYTYVLGPAEAVRTPVQRLIALAEKGATAELKDVTDAFSVERLNREFFSTYKKHYQLFCDHLFGSNAPKKICEISLAGLDDKARDRALKPVRDFVKKLLGRLVFLYFLQKKGWLGCPREQTEWTNGNPNFIGDLFEICAKKDRFHSERLIPLFFDTLNNRSRPNDIFPITGTRVPYLNGGLFERDFDAVIQVDFPANLFADLLGFFGQYNFTVDENDPDDREIGIDPEMLGHIFENLLEDNKDKGAYYTPKPVVQYMCQQSLIHYLRAHFSADDADATGEIERLIRDKDPIDPRDTRSWIPRNASYIDELLDSVKICDPAIGSGAFPMGLLQEIYWTKLTLHPGADRAATKRAIIQHSIHGVDIDDGAVEIARLRCWLALIVDEEIPLPLPNLDYQIMQGNSLFESFEGEPLHDLDQPMRLGVRRVLGSDQHELDLKAGQIELSEEDATTANSRQNLAELRERYFACHDPAEKEQIRRKIDIAVLHALDARLDRRREEIEHSLAIRRAEEEKKKRANKRYQTSATVEKRLTQDQAELDSLEGKRARLHALLADRKAERPFFLWHFWFRDIFADGGFDIVIANPPYGAELSTAERRSLTDEFPTVPDYESSNYFLLAGLKLTKLNSIECFILPNTWLVNRFATKFRQHLLRETEIVFINDCSGFAVFNTASVRNSIAVFKNRQPQSDYSVEFSVFSSVGGRLNTRYLSTTTLSATFDNWLTHFSSETESLRLVQKIRRSSGRLKDFTESSQGLIPYDKYRGHDADTIKNRIWHSKVRKDRTYKPELRGGDVSRYAVKWNGHTWISYGKWLAAPRNPKFFRSERILIREITNPRILAAYTNQEYYNTPSIINVINFKGLDPFYVLGVLNSTLISFVHIETSPKSKKGLFPKILVNDVRDLPVIDVGSKTQQKIANLARRVVATKSDNLHANTTKLETEIDNHVYRLYGLTPEEIALIENSMRARSGSAEAES